MPIQAKLQQHHRSSQILKLLIHHGQLSKPTLLQIIKPKITDRRLREILQRLSQKGFIVIQYDKIFGHHGVFYRLTEHPERLKKISLITGISLQEINPPFIRHSELLHSQSCTAWAIKLGEIFPESKILSEHEFSTQNDFGKYFWINKGKAHFDQRPDVLLTLPKTDGTRNVCIAIEIERNNKSRKRLVEKIKKYTDESLVDGVIYVCSNDSIQRRLIDAYKSKTHHDLIRIRNYKHHFLVFATEKQNFENFNPLLISTDGDTLRLKEWIDVFIRLTRFELRDASFTDQPKPAGDTQL